MSIAHDARIKALEDRVAALEARLGPEHVTDEAREIMREVNESRPVPEKKRKAA